MDAKTRPNAIFFNDWNNSFIPNILHEIYYERIYHPFIGGGLDTIVDLGANIGITSFFFKDHAKDVYAIEPSAKHLGCINELVNHNGITNIHVCPYAISNKDGKARFYHNQNTTMYSLKDTVNDQKDYEEVETLTFKSFMDKEGIQKIDLLKWDTEGAESEIVSSDEFRECAPKIQTIIFEYHTWTAMSPSLFINSLKDLGFECRWLQNTEAKIGVATRL